MTIAITAVPWDDADAVALRAAQRVEIEERYGTPDSEPGIAPTAGDIAFFAIARDSAGTAVSCGGLRLLGDGAAEVKRMYAAPAARGTGAATAILRALEDEARRRGLHTLKLETGTAQPDAVRFYTREGYTPIDAFGAYTGPGSLCFGKTL